jgi:hypothetical protein
VGLRLGATLQDPKQPRTLRELHLDTSYNVPPVIKVGMSSREAVATNMFAVLFMTVSATARFAQDKLISGRFVLPR